MIYLDYNASTPIDPAVREAMLPYLERYFGNPSSSHGMGRPGKEAVLSPTRGQQITSDSRRSSGRSGRRRPVSGFLSRKVVRADCSDSRF